MKQARRRPVGAAAVIEESAPADEAASPIVQRPDGFYWVAPDGRQSFGPFDTPSLARADRDRFEDGGPEPAETLQEAESEISIADWIDPETGEPAEGFSSPHLPEE
jgi:hypothetical protein